jgi:hypothetical protein
MAGPSIVAQWGLYAETPSPQGVPIGEDRGTRDEGVLAGSGETTRCPYVNHRAYCAPPRLANVAMRLRSGCGAPVRSYRLHDRAVTPYHAAAWACVQRFTSRKLYGIAALLGYSSKDRISADATAVLLLPPAP